MTENTHISDLKPDKQNARKHTPRNIGMIEKSLQEVGAARSIVIDEDNNILAGNGTVEGAAQAGITKLKIVEVDGDTIVAVRRSGLSAEQKKKLALYDNRTAELAEWDVDVLKDLESELDLSGMFTEKELVGIGFAEETINEDEVPELPNEPKTVRGDLYELGRHRLLCGDSTDSDDVSRLFGGAKFVLMVTSPPYAQQRRYEIGEFDWDKLMSGVFTTSLIFMDSAASFLVNLGLVHSDGKVLRYWDRWIDEMEKLGLPLYGWYVWDKLNGLMGDWRGRLAPSHEFIFHFAKNPRRANKTQQTKYRENGVRKYKKSKVGLRNAAGDMNGFSMAGETVNDTKVADSVIRCQPQRGGVDGHPAPFSVAFASELLLPFSCDGDVVYEPFCGSGTMIIAAEQLGRTCYGMELEPKYCDVIVSRYVKLTGNTKVKRNGEEIEWPVDTK